MGLTLVTGQDIRQVRDALFNYKGSTCSMVTKKMVRELGIESINTDIIDTECMVLELLNEDGSLALIRAYVVESITSMAKVEIPDRLQSQFKKRKD